MHANQPNDGSAGIKAKDQWVIIFILPAKDPVIFVGEISHVPSILWYIY